MSQNSLNLALLAVCAICLAACAKNPDGTYTVDPGIAYAKMVGNEDYVSDPEYRKAYGKKSLLEMGKSRSGADRLEDYSFSFSYGYGNGSRQCGFEEAGAPAIEDGYIVGRLTNTLGEPSGGHIENLWTPAGGGEMFETETTIPVIQPGETATVRVPIPKRPYKLSYTGGVISDKEH